MKKFKLNWQSLMLGVVLCAVLFVFIGSKVAGPQVTGPLAVKTQALNRPANLNDVYEMTASLDARTAAMDERLVRVEQKIDSLENDMKAALRHLGKILNAVEKR
jgi:hypothetical protein